MTRRVGSPLVLQVLRRQADRREREDLACRRRSPSSRRSTLDAPIRQLRADARRADRSSRTARRRCPRPMRAVGWTIAVSWMTTSRRVRRRPRRGRRPARRRGRSSASATTWPSTDATAGARASRPRRRPSVTSSSSRSPGTTWRRNFALSTPRSQRAAVRRACRRTAGASRPASSDSIISTPGISGVPGKVSLEELLVDRDVLDGDDAPPGLVLRDGVDEHRRIAVGQALEDRRDVHQRVIWPRH